VGRFRPCGRRRDQKTPPRPAIVSKDSANRFLNRVQVVLLSSNTSKLYPSEAGVRVEEAESKAMADQLTTADKSRLTEQLGTLSAVDLRAVENATRVQLAL